MLAFLLLSLFLPVYPTVPPLSNPSTSFPIFTSSLTTQSVETTGPESCEPGPSYDPLACWLYNLKINVPDIEVKEGFATITISSLYCEHFGIETIASSYPNSQTLSVSASGLVAACGGHYHVTGGFHGDVTMEIQDSSIDLSVLFKSDPTNYMSVGGNVTDCSTSIVIPKSSLKFTGSITAVLADLFRSPIADYMTDLLSTKVCDPLSVKLDSTLTKAILAMDTFILKVIENGPDKIGWLPEEDLVRWTDAGKVQDFLLNMNGFLESHLGPPTPSTKSSATESVEVFAALHYDERDHNDPQCDGNTLPKNGINGIITKLTDGEISIPLNSTSANIIIDGVGALKLSLDVFNISGINSLTNLTILEPRDEHSLSTGVGMKKLNLTLSIALQVSSIPGGMIVGPPLEERFHLDLILSDVELLGVLLLAVEKDFIEELTVYQLMYTNKTSVYWPCLLSTLYTANFTDLTASMKISAINLLPDAEIGKPLESALDKLIDDTIALFVNDYNQLVTDSIYGILQGPVRRTVNNILHKAISTTKENTDNPSSPCPDTPKTYQNKSYIYFDENDFIANINAAVNENFGVDGINSLLLCSHEILEDLGKLKGDLFVFDGYGIHLDVRDLVWGPDVGYFTDFQLLVPEIDHYHMNNIMALGECSYLDNLHNNNCHPMTIGVTVDLDFPAKKVRDTFNISVSLADLRISLGLSSEIDTNRLNSLKIGDLATRECLLSAVDSFELYGGSINMGAFEAVVVVDHEGKVKRDVWNGTETTALINQAMKSAILTGLNSANDYARQKLYEAPYICAGEPIPSDDPTNKVLWWKSGMALLGYTCCSILFVFVYIQKNRGRTRSLSTLSGRRSSDQSATLSKNRPQYAFDEGSRVDGGGLDHPLIDRVGGSGSSADSNIDASATSSDSGGWGQSLMYHPNVGLVLGFSVPVVIIGTIVLLLISNLSVGAEVGMKVETDEQTIVIPPLFSFSLGNTMHDMWDAKVYILAVMIGVFSGAWPYLKLLLMLFSWMAPASVLPVYKREQLLMWLDALGKYSLVDTYVLVLMMVAFRFHLSLDKIEATPSFLTIDVFVTPEFGFYGFLLATMTSLAMGHIILAYHRHAVANYEIPRGGRKESLKAHVFTILGGTKKIRLTRFAQSTLFSLLVFAIVLLGIGVCTESFNFEFKGAAGLVLGDGATQSFSLVSLGERIPQSVEDPENFGIRWIETTYYLFALGMPFLCLGTMLTLWLVKLNVKQQVLLFVFAEITNAWSAIEVFVISVACAILQISQFAAFIIGDKCDAINSVLEQFFDAKLEGDDVCFDVVATLGPECGYLFTGAVLACVTSWTLLKFGHHAIDERMRRGAGGLGVKQDMHQGSHADLDITKDPKHNTSSKGLIEVLFLKFGGCMFRELGDFEDSIYDSDNEGAVEEYDSVYKEGDTITLRGGGEF